MQAEADDWIEEEFGNTNKMNKKQKKKGSNDQKATVDNSEEKGSEIVEADEPAEVKILSKKEKEKLKKQKEKEKKKADSEKKKTQLTTKNAESIKEENDTVTVTVPAEESKPPSSDAPPDAPLDVANDDEEDEDDDSKKKKKKKKKKPAAEEEKKTSSKKKPTAALAAIRAKLEADRAAEEERIRKEQEEKRRIEAEQERIKEAERLKEEAKRMKKEREKAKKEELKKSGRYLSQKQRAKLQQDKMRLEQMIKSGYKIEGLDKEGEQAPRRVVYANKKKGPTKQTLDKTETEVLTFKADDKPETSENLKDEREIDANKDVKENWEKDEDVESNKSTEINDGIRDTWDVSSDEIDDTSSEDEKIPKNVTTPVKTDTDKKKEPAKVVDTDKKKGPAKVVDTDKKKGPAKVVDTDKKKAPAKVVDTDSTQKNVSVKDAELEDASESGSDESETEEDSDEDSDEETDSEKITEHQRQMQRQKADAAERRKKRHEEALAARSKDNLRSPICCILGHVDTGKCFGKGTPILMYDGRIKAVETIKEGEQVMGDDSTPRNVSGVTSGKGILYKIVPINNSFAQPFVCNDAHILVLKMVSGPSLQQECNKYGETVFRLVYFTYDRATNLIKKTSKPYPVRNTDYSTINNANQAAIRDLELLNKVGNFSSNSSSSIVRPGFIWQPTVTQFLNCDPEVQSQAKMFTPEKVRFPSQEGAFANIKREVTKSHKKEQYWGFKVEEIGIGDYYGFVVDGNHRFLLGDFTVTHNTKLLDKIRQTNVQEGEAGGITQQIGATYFPMETIKMKTAPINKDGKQEYKLPGLLIIDTPGHESFTNLRSRGSSLCNIAILVVDIMHGLEPQTLESIRLLRDRKTPFIVALNKIDRIYDWKPVADNAFRDSLEKQSQSVKREFKDRVEKTILAFQEQGLNACLYYENKNFAKYVSLVPTSAITGEGIPDMLMLLVNLTQTRMSDKLMYLSELECTVLEVKVIEGLGTTIDVVLSNGVLNEGDKIVLCGLNGPIVTTIRALLTPQPLRELRVKSAYVHHKSVKAALGIKISAQDLEKAVAGSRLMVCGPDDDEDELKDEIMSDLKSMLNSVDKSGRGVCVQASTLGSLEALLEFLRVSNIPVSGISIGPVHKKDIMRAGTMLEKARELAVILCFDVKVEKEAQELAKELGIKIFEADIIYHLFDQFTAYNKDIIEQKRRDQAPQAVFPCVLRIVPGAIFNKRDPIVVGVDVVEGVLRTGTPICVVKVDPVTKAREIINLGKVASMEQNHKAVEVVKKAQSGAGVAVKLECPGYETPKMFGRHFVESDELYSRISRQSINVLKESFRNDLSKEEWALVVKLKKILEIE